MDETIGLLDRQPSVCEQQTLPMEPGQKIVPLPLPKPKPPTSKSTISDALLAYRVHMKDNKMSDHTVKSYANDASIFQHYLEEDRVVTNVSKEDIMAFIQHLKRVLHESPKSVQRRISSLKAFFKYLHLRGAIPTNPALLVPCWKIVPPLPDCLTESECLSLLSKARENPLDYLIIYLLVEIGLKKNELLKAKKQDFDLSNAKKPELTVRYNNGQRIRNIVLSEECGIAYETYTKNMENNKEIMFQISERDLTRHLKDLARKSGVSKDVSCQVLRDSSAVRRLKRGEDMETVLKRLGLAYVKDIIKKYEKLAPKAI